MSSQVFSDICVQSTLGITGGHTEHKAGSGDLAESVLMSLPSPDRPDQPAD